MTYNDHARKNHTFHSHDNGCNHGTCPEYGQYRLQKIRNVLWDWDSWLSNVAIHQAAADQGDKALAELDKYEKGCVLNFLGWSGIDGWVDRKPVIREF